MSDVAESSDCKMTTADTRLSFLSLPGELRNGVYELVLLHPEPVDPWAFYREQKLTPGLLRANKAVHAEASQLFYSQNCLAFTKVPPEELASFLKQIGSNNAGYIQHVLIDFPQFRYPYREKVALTEASISTLAIVQNNCPSLRTLTTSVGSTDDMEYKFGDRLHGRAGHKLKDQAREKIIARAFRLVDARFRAISSLEEIIAQVFDFAANRTTRRVMESYGWTIRTRPFQKWDLERGFFSEPEDNGTDRESDGGFGQEFDGGFGQEFDGGFGQGFNGGFGQEFDDGIEQDFDSDTDPEFDGGLDQEFDGGLDQEFDGGLDQEFESDWATDQESDGDSED